MSEKNKQINSFDIDGVIDIEGPGIFPGPDDVIITGRSHIEQNDTLLMLRDRGIRNFVHFNMIPFNEKTRQSSGEHKANVLNKLREEGVQIKYHFEDDLIQKVVIERQCPWITVIHVDHDETEKENLMRPYKGEK